MNKNPESEKLDKSSEVEVTQNDKVENVDQHITPAEETTQNKEQTTESIEPAATINVENQAEKLDKSSEVEVTQNDKVENIDQHITPTEETTQNKEQTTESIEPAAVIVEDEKEKLAEQNSEESEPKKETTSMTKDEIIEKLKKLKSQEDVPARQEVDALRHTFYNIRRAEVEEERGKFDENAEEGEVFAPSVDPLEDVLKVYLENIKEKRAGKLAEEEKQKEKNLKKKLEIIESIKALTESTEDFNKLFQEFKDLQHKWNSIKLIPQSKLRELWTEYQIHSEKFYDLVKINNELRDYDFKKNLELKTEICEVAEKLVGDADPVSAFHQLQNFHQQWREIGPVERNIREELWGKFKDISTEINKNYQAHFESLKGQEEDNLNEKQAIISELKEIDYSKIKSFRDWESKTKEVIKLQTKWRTIGFVPRKVNNEIFQEFRGLCDVFFENKSEFFKKQRDDMESNLVKKRALTDRVLELKDSTDWNKTTQELIKIQKDWKSIGPVPRKHSDAIWREFVGACDHFFEQKKKEFSSKKDDEIANYDAKKAVVAKIEAVDHSLDISKLMAELKVLQDEWHQIGFVPYKDKDKSYKELYAAVDAHYDRLKINKDERRFEEFKSNVENKIANKDNPERALSRERNQLMYQYNKVKSDLQTYQNNMSFLTLSSKGKKENPLLKDVNKKIEALKNEMELMEKKINTLDSNLDELE